jgi:hypothetical protein
MRSGVWHCSCVLLIFGSSCLDAGAALEVGGEDV